MKKFYSFFLVLALAAWFSPASLAAFVEFSPKVVYRDYEEADSSVGAGVSVDVKEVFPAKEVVLTGGVEYIGTESHGVDGSIKTVSAGAGYDFNFDYVMVRPYGSIDFAFMDAEDGFDASNEVGFSLGVRGDYSVMEYIRIFAGVGYQWLDTNISYGAASADLDLDNFNLQSGLSISF